MCVTHMHSSLQIEKRSEFLIKWDVSTALGRESGWRLVLVWCPHCRCQRHSLGTLPSCRGLVCFLEPQNHHLRTSVDRAALRATGQSRVLSVPRYSEA